MPTGLASDPPPGRTCGELATAMEFVLDALHQYSKIAKDDVDTTTVYKDLIGSIFQRQEETLEEEP